MHSHREVARTSERRGAGGFLECERMLGVGDGRGGPVSCFTHLLPFCFRWPSDVGARTSDTEQHLIICYMRKRADVEELQLASEFLTECTRDNSRHVSPLSSQKKRKPLLYIQDVTFATVPIGGPTFRK